MKKFFCYTTSILTAFILFQSCKKSGSFLDNRAATALTEDLVFTDSVRTLQFLGRIYEDDIFFFNPGRFSAAGTPM